MHWIYLSVAILFEVAGTTCMKLSEGFTRPLPSICVGVFYCICFYCLTIAMKKIDLSVTYAIWSGVGMALISAIGVLYFREPVTALKILGTLAIIGGIVALNLAEKAS